MLVCYFVCIAVMIPGIYFVTGGRADEKAFHVASVTLFLLFAPVTTQWLFVKFFLQGKKSPRPKTKTDDQLGPLT